MIFILIPVFNRKALTVSCIESLRKQTYKNFTVIIIDDGSSDGTGELLAKDFPEVIVIKGDGNLWWAGATNAGLDYVFSKKTIGESDFILTLNNDLEVPVNYLENLVNAAAIHKNAIIGSISVDINNPEHMDFCGIRWNEFTAKYFSKAKEYNYSYSLYQRTETFTESDMLPGRGTLIPVSVFRQIGKFDSKTFPQYASDEDFSLRAKRNGWNLLLSPSIIVKSHIEATGINSKEIRFSINYLRQLFFSIRSPLNLKIRYRWAIKNTKLKLLYFFLETSRIFYSLIFKKLKTILTYKN